MKIAILGTNGFLSNCIAEYCNLNNHEIEMYGLEKPVGIKCLNYYNLNLTENILDYSKLIKNDIIVYTIGAGIQSNLNEGFKLIYDLNVNAPIFISNKLKEIDYKGVFITFGSYYEIGENREDKKYTEDMLLMSTSPTQSHYSISKRLLSRFISSFNASFVNWHFILPTIYGEKEAPHRLIPYTINALKNNLPLNFTSGNQVRQYIYVNEIPQIIFKSYKYKLISGIYNIEGTETLTVKEIVKIIFLKFGLEFPEELFGKTQRSDTGMQNLQLNGSKLYSIIEHNPEIKILDVYDRYGNTFQ